MGSEHLFEEQVGVAVAGIVVAMVALLAFYLSVRRRASRAVTGREALTAEQFAALFHTEKERAVAAAIRGQLARHIPVDAALVRPDDRLCEELQLGAVDGLDANEFVIEVEKTLGVKISDAAAQKMLTLRELVSYVAARAAL